MSFVFAPLPTPSLPIVGEEDRFPVRRIFCVGRNYAAHAREMGKDPDRDPPFFFTKPADAIVQNDETVAYPPETGNFHYEAELVVAIGRDGVNVPKEAALDLVYGYGVGNDLTRRDLQLEAREKGRPWDWGKAFDRSAPIAAIHKAADVGHLSTGSITLTVNGETKQEADLNELIWDVQEVVSIISHSVALKAGDLIMTGTPAGVGKLVPGDVCVVSIDGLTPLTTTIGPAA